MHFPGGHIHDAGEYHVYNGDPDSLLFGLFQPGESICNGLRSLEYFNPNGDAHYFGSAVSGEQPDNGIYSSKWFYNPRIVHDTDEDDDATDSHYGPYNASRILDPTGEWFGNPYCLDEKYCKMLTVECNSLTPDNFTWNLIKPKGLSGFTSFEGQDAAVAYAVAHGQTVLGQHLLWYLGLPTGFSTTNHALQASLIQDHVMRISERQRNYWGDTIRGWAVVNEFLENVGWLNTPPTGAYSATYERAQGGLTYDVAKAAFVRARSELPDTYLYYNDYSNESIYTVDSGAAYVPSSAPADTPSHIMYSMRCYRCFKLVEKLYNEPTINGRHIIDGVGFQCHISAWRFRQCKVANPFQQPECDVCPAFSPEEMSDCELIDLADVAPFFEPWLEGIVENVSALRALGLNSEITELDIDISNPDNYSWCHVPAWWRELSLEARECIQGKMYRRILETAKCLNMNVTVWDLADKYSWLAYNNSQVYSIDPDCALCGEDDQHYEFDDDYSKQQINAHLYDRDDARKPGAYFNGALQAFRTTATCTP